MTRRTSHPLPLPALPAVALLALALGACAERTRYAPIALNETSIGLLERVRTYYVRTGDRHAMACQTDPAYAKRFADCGDLAQRHHPQARDIVQATLLANGCRIVFVWGDPTEYAPGERVGGIAAQPDGIVRFKHPLGPHEGAVCQCHRPGLRARAGAGDLQARRARPRHRQPQGRDRGRARAAATLRHVGAAHGRDHRTATP
jgi:hypothetical protein